MLKCDGEEFVNGSALRNYLNKLNVHFDGIDLRLLDHYYRVLGPVDLVAIRYEMINSIVNHASCYSYKSIDGVIYTGSKKEIKDKVFKAIDGADPYIDGGRIYIFDYMIWGSDTIKNLINNLKKNIGAEIDSL